MARLHQFLSGSAWANHSLRVVAGTDAAVAWRTSAPIGSARVRRFNSARRDAGFNIVEVMMATTILLVGFIGLIQAVTMGSDSLDSARKQQVAQQLISGEIEKLRGSAWTTIANLPASASLSIGSNGTVSGDFTSFALSNYTATTADDNTALAGLARGFTCSLARERLRPSGATATTVTYVKLVYTVSWTTNTGRAQRHIVETYLGMNGLHLSFQQS